MSLSSDQINKSERNHKAGEFVGEPSSSSLSSFCRSAIVFSPSLAKRLSDERFPPTYVGVRRVRPSSRTVQRALATTAGLASRASIEEEAAAPPKSTISYTITDEATGTTRRMSSQEKKQLRFQIRKERTEEKKRIKQQKQAQQEHQQGPETSIPGSSEREGGNEQKRTAEKASQQDAESAGFAKNNGEKNGRGRDVVETDQRYQMNINQSALQDELADIRGERDGVPPVAVCPAVTRQALLRRALANPGGRGSDVSPLLSTIQVSIDDELASEWSRRLRDSMLVAERVRQGEAMRPLPYVLKPEPWSRMRPGSLSSLFQGKVGMMETQKHGVAANDEDEGDSHDDKTPARGGSWAFCHIQPCATVCPSSAINSSFRAHHEAVIQLLHEGTSNLHISCGAKFGCDYLLYDGPRQNVHAFAGLRVVVNSDNTSCSSISISDDSRLRGQQLPIPATYDMSGYVRCLNTACKLALIATVIQDVNSPAKFRVAIVDLALEKVAVTTFSNKRKNKYSSAKGSRNEKKIRQG